MQIKLLLLLLLSDLFFSQTSLMCPLVTSLVAELLRGRRPREWSPIPILRGVLVIFYGHGKRNGSQARAPYVHTSHFMTFLYEAIGVGGIAQVF